MNILVNNKPHPLPSTSTLQGALASLNIPLQKGIAIAVNDEVIPKGQWETFTLKEADKVTIIRATQGG